MSIMNVELVEIDDREAVAFTLDNKDLLEWINYDTDGLATVERIDSYLECHYVGDTYVSAIHDMLDDILESQYSDAE